MRAVRAPRAGARPAPHSQESAETAQISSYRPCEDVPGKRGEAVKGKRETERGELPSREHSNSHPSPLLLPCQMHSKRKRSSERQQVCPPSSRVASHEQQIRAMKEEGGPCLEIRAPWIATGERRLWCGIGMEYVIFRSGQARWMTPPEGVCGRVRPAGTVFFHAERQSGRRRIIPFMMDRVGRGGAGNRPCAWVFKSCNNGMGPS